MLKKNTNVKNVKEDIIIDPKNIKVLENYYQIYVNNLKMTKKRKPPLSTMTTYNRISALPIVYLDLDHDYKNSSNMHLNQAS